MELTPERKAILEREIERLRANPELYDQKIYARRGECGTACCIAGGIALDNGLRHRPKNNDWFGPFVDQADRTVFPDRFAGGLLGLSGEGEDGEWTGEMALFSP